MTEQKLIEQIAEVNKQTCHFAISEGKCAFFDECGKDNNKIKCAFASEQTLQILALLTAEGYVLKKACRKATLQEVLDRIYIVQSGVGRGSGRVSLSNLQWLKGELPL